MSFMELTTYSEHRSVFSPAPFEAELLNAIETFCEPGLIRQMLLDHLCSGGKRLRAKLCLSAHAALGPSFAYATPFAVACELLHNATLIHDDIQDGDEFRRGHPTLWKKYGTAQAIIAGDAMLMLPIQMLARVPESMRFELCSVMADVALRLGRGQLMESEMFACNDVAELNDLYAKVSGLKTAALFELPIYGAARLAGRTRTEARSLAAPFAQLGVAFQRRDDLFDLLDLKDRGSQCQDLLEGKVSAVVLCYLESRPEEFRSLIAFLSGTRAQKSPLEVQQWIFDFETAGVVERLTARIIADTTDFLSELGADGDLRACGEEFVDVILAPLKLTARGG